MKVKILLENTSANPNFKSSHGLSIYLETAKHKILFDVGPNNYFIENALALGIDLSMVDTVVISHGHFDHGGGLKSFLKLNSSAKIYVQKNIFAKHYSNRGPDKISDIGLNSELESNEQIIFVKDYLRIDEELEIFADVKNKYFMPSDNKELLQQQGQELFTDDFKHEQNLIVNSNNKIVVLSGCAHRGILNIMDKAMTIIKGEPDYVIGGFHLYSNSRQICEDSAKIEQIALSLKNLTTKFYTCHCTGIKPFKMLRAVMGEKIEYISTGTELVL